MQLLNLLHIFAACLMKTTAIAAEAAFAADDHHHSQ
jgi:hypothetical protein